MAERNERVRNEQNLLVEMDPEIAEIYERSTMISCKLQAAGRG